VGLQADIIDSASHELSAQDGANYVLLPSSRAREARVTRAEIVPRSPVSTGWIHQETETDRCFPGRSATYSATVAVSK
jgi:hypothetical protein